MKTLLLAITASALVAPAAAQVPFSRNIQEGQVPSTINTLAVGNIPDGSGPSADSAVRVGTTGIPVVEYILDAPPAASSDYFANDLVVSSTGEKIGTFLNTSNAINSATGVPFTRNIVVTPSEATTGTLVLVVADAQNVRRSHTISFVNSSAAVTTAWTAREIVSATVTTPFSAGTLDIGTGVVFGLPYPMYADTILHDFFDTDGVGYPASAVTVTAVAGDPSTATADDYGTVSFGSDVPDGANDYVLWYIPTLTWRPDPSNGYPSTSWDLR